MKGLRHWVTRTLFAITLVSVILSAPGARAQFTATVTGTVVDPSGAVVPNAVMNLTSDATDVTLSAKTNAAGLYTFPNLAPGNYHLTCIAKGFNQAMAPATVQTNQVLSVPIKLVVGSSIQTVQVTTQSPLLDTADSRIQETITSSTLSDLPLSGENMVSLVTMAPGAVGTGVASTGSPGSGRDNYSTETQVDTSSNGQGPMGDQYIVDGLDVTSSIRAGVLNLEPSPDAIQETSIQTDNYSVLYGRADSAQMTMTTKSGTDQYHGNIEEFFYDQQMFAGTEFTHHYLPFHNNNISASVGGPVWPGKKWGFWFFEIEPQLASNAVSNTTTFADPAFIQWAKTNYPDTIGTKVLTSYPVSNVTNTAVSLTAANIFPTTSNEACGTAATNFLPCDTAMIDSADFNASEYRNADQYFIRGDEDLNKDHIYGTIFRTTLNTNAPNVYPAFTSTQKYWEWAMQANEIHTFNANTINQASFGADRVEGISPDTGLFDAPVVNVTGVGAGYGDGFAAGDFIQQNYHWRDMLTHLLGNHDIQGGFEGMFGTDVEYFQGPYDQPTFDFNNLLDLAQDNVFTEGGLAYNPLTGLRSQWTWNAAGATFGAFLQDTWKASSRLTVNYGLRWDDYGNPYSRSTNTALSNFYFGSGATEDEQIANGILVEHHHALERSITDVFSPRGGVAWDVRGNGNWVIKAGAGIFHNWPTLANLEEEYRGNPPGDIFPTFYGGQTPAPIFGYGTSNSVPFNFPAPVYPATGLDAAGGVAGVQFTVGGINPTLKSPVTYVYSGGLYHKIGSHFVASIDYSGANGRYLLSGGGVADAVSYGQDINEFNDDLIINKSLVPTRLNHSFGEVIYTTNDRYSNYNAMILQLQGTFSRSSFSASYTRSSSWDDTQVYPSKDNVAQWYGPSDWNAPNRFSLIYNYLLPNVNDGHGLLGRIASGWALSGTAAIQSGYPFNVSTNAPFEPVVSSTGQFVAYEPGSGDYNANGDNYAFPNVSSYTQGTSRHAFLTGAVKLSQFPQPTFGLEGNEQFNRFVGPNYQEWDTGLRKDTNLVGNVNFQFRFDVFNTFNHPNLTGMDTNLPDGTFGQATNQLTPRYIQFGGNLTF